MKKVFISQPMRGKSDESILAVRDEMIEFAKKEVGDDIEVIDSFFRGAPIDASPLWYLGKSIELLSTADLVIFAPDWEYFRGCRIEYDCVIAYDIKFLIYKSDYMDSHEL